MTDIARHATFTTGAIYYHFPDKHSLAVAVIAEQNERSFRAMAWAQNTEPGIGGVILASERLARLFLTDPFVRAGVRISLEQSAVATETADSYRGWIETLAAVYRRARTDGILRPDVSVEVAARGTLQFFTGAQIMSDAIDRWGGLYRDVLGMWNILIPGIIVADHQGRLLKIAQTALERPQPKLNRRVRR